MDKQKLIDLVSQVAEIKILKPATSPTMRLDDTHQNDVKVGDEWIHINKEENPTLCFKIVKLKPVQRLCELGCGDVVANQQVEKRLCITPVNHWRTQCITCGCFVSPDGQGFIKGAHSIQAAYMLHFKKDKAKSKGKQQEESSESDNQITDYGRTTANKWIRDEEGNIRLRESSDK